MQKYAIAIHGGAGTLLRGQMTSEKEKKYINALRESLRKGFQVLEEGKSAVDAVELAVKILEDSPLFNAGKGSVFTATGDHEMDAAIMDGSNLEAGAVSLISGIKNPVSLARKVMEDSPHVFLAGSGAMKFAKEKNLERKDDTYFFDQFRYDQWQEVKGTTNVQLDHTTSKNSKFGTVGAVACDKNGNIAAATSTGGMTNKNYGRIGDSPLIGIGNYANNKTCAVSCTGNGEFFIRSVTAYDVSCLMEYKNLSLAEASNEVVMKKLVAIKGEGGLIAIDAQGNISMPFNSDGMYRGFKNSEEENISIYED
ncbi:isoaspartyl peptidase/L-asparaginase [Gramella sp. AN32]|uniref:Isoaspartyl peptidase/L-asparaginase family protein n=1 Tax=Christiangramia antarctica TaxID=2058158 RepID=A0ABW5X1V5_9FLAO|nr:isoaspartyl peptidase/L-asparaginase [Gramella sp. AN32]MCM4155674.1 beta-aspartyl-peptidase [Gramella sp. AN32]